MYLVGTTSFEVDGSEGVREDINLHVTPLKIPQVVSLKKDFRSKAKQVMKKAIYFPDFELKLDVGVEDKSLREPEVDDDAIEVEITESRGVQVTPENSREDIRDIEDDRSIPYYDDDERSVNRSIHLMSKVPSSVDKIITAEVSSIKKSNKSGKAPVVFERTTSVFDSITNGAALIASDIGIISKKPEPYEEKLHVDDDETVRTNDTRLY